MDIPTSHPRHESLMQRHRIEEGLREGYVTLTGMIAQGRGEAFDYLIGERTTEPALRAERAASAKLSQMRTVISVNGNVAALCPKEVVELASSLNAQIEVNLFYWSGEREERIAEILREAGAKKVCGIGEKVSVPGLESARGKVDPEGMYKADAVLVMLEDGDRTEALKRMGKFVAAIDLNPFSRTAQQADITIVDNVVRALPNMTRFAEEDCSVTSFDNEKNLEDSVREVRRGLNP